MLKVSCLELKVSVNFFLSILLSNTKLRAVQCYPRESLTKAWCLWGNLGMFSSNKQKLATHFVDMNDIKQEGKWPGKDKMELEEIKGIYHDLTVPISIVRSQWNCINFDIWKLELSLSFQMSSMFHFHYLLIFSQAGLRICYWIFSKALLVYTYCVRARNKVLWFQILNLL